MGPERASFAGPDLEWTRDLVTVVMFSIGSHDGVDGDNQGLGPDVEHPFGSVPPLQRGPEEGTLEPKKTRCNRSTRVQRLTAVGAEGGKRAGCSAQLSDGRVCSGTHLAQEATQRKDYRSR